MSFALKARSGKVHPDAADDRAGSFTSAAGGAAADLSRTGSLRSTTGLSKTIIRRAGSGPLERADSLRRTAEAKGLALGDAEHAEWLAEKVRTEGRRDAKNLFRFYCRMLIPVGILTLWAFAFVATLSWSIPNRLCNRIAKENSVRAGGGAGRPAGACAAALYLRSAGAPCLPAAAHWSQRRRRHIVLPLPPAHPRTTAGRRIWPARLHLQSSGL